MTFYIGPEVNHTSAFSKKTLFVENFNDTCLIAATATQNKAPHISLGAKDSFDPNFDWNSQITHLLDSGFIVTLEYPAELHSSVIFNLSAGVLQSRNFVPLVKVNIREMSTLNPNLSVKVDDSTGNGAWCLHYHQIMDSNRFTASSEFEFAKVDPASNVAPFHPIVVPAPVAQAPMAAPVKVDPVETPVQNNTELGLDIDSPSLLKPDPDAVSVTDTVIVNTPTAAAELYAKDATVDPLAKEAAKKVKSKKAEA